MSRRFLTAQWRHLAMLNYEIDPDILRPLVPCGVELDSWNGHCFASVVGFLFLDTRVLGIPILCHRNFEEVNLRFYVRREMPDGPRRGVAFIKEVVPRWAIATVARRIYNENYVCCWMASAIREGSVEYRWAGASGWHAIRAEMEGTPSVPATGSEEEFIAEHYWGYVGQRDGSTLEYQVEHPPWRVWRATRASLECDVGCFYGPGFAAALGGTPTSAFVAEGSAITVRKGARLS